MIKAARQAFDPSFAFRLLKRSPDFQVGRDAFHVEVLPDRELEKQRRLRDDRHGAAKRRTRQIADVGAVDEDVAVDFIQAEQCRQ